MAVIIGVGSETYQSIRKAYRENCGVIKWMDTEGFIAFMQENKAKVMQIDLSKDQIAYACDEFGLIPDRDYIEFPDDRDFTVFSLKWL